jgi:hypothetical protein
MEILVDQQLFLPVLPTSGSVIGSGAYPPSPSVLGASPQTHPIALG